MTRKKNIARKQRWVYYVEMLPDDVGDRPGLAFTHAEDVEPLEFDREPSEGDIARAISKQGFRVSEHNVDGDEDEDGLSNFKGETDDGEFFFNADPDGNNPKRREKNPLRQSFWRPDPPHGPEVHDLREEKLDLAKLKETGLVVAIKDSRWAPCSTILAKVFKDEDDDLVYSSRDEREGVTSLLADDDDIEIARGMGWDGPRSYSQDQADEMIERMYDLGPWKGLTRDEQYDASEFLRGREDEAFDDPGYF